MGSGRGPTKGHGLAYPSHRTAAARQSTYCVPGPERSTGETGRHPLPPPTERGRGLGRGRDHGRDPVGTRAGTLPGPCARRSRARREGPHRPGSSLPLAGGSLLTWSSWGTGWCSRPPCVLCCARPISAPAWWASPSPPPSRYPRHLSLGSGARAEQRQTHPCWPRVHTPNQ